VKSLTADDHVHDGGVLIALTRRVDDPPARVDFGITVATSASTTAFEMVGIKPANSSPQRVFYGSAGALAKRYSS